MNSMRTKETQAKYKAYQDAGGLNDGCVLCDRKTTKEFKYWKIIPNDFPYDRITEIHDIIFPVRHVTEYELNADELAELRELKEKYLNENYEYIIESTYKMKSVPEHHHLHLITVRGG